MNRRSLLQMLGFGAAAAVVPVEAAVLAPVNPCKEVVLFDDLGPIFVDVDLGDRIVTVPTRITRLGDRLMDILLDAPFSGTVRGVTLRQGERRLSQSWGPFHMVSGDTLSIAIPITLD